MDEKLPASYVRKEVRRHNSFLGHVAMAKRNMRTIGSSFTATREASQLAQEIVLKLEHLEKALRTRVDPPVLVDYYKERANGR